MPHSFNNSHDNLCEMLSTREAHLKLSTQGFNRCWSWKHPLPTMYQNSRLPVGKQVFRINHIVCTNNVATVSHSYQFWNPLSQMPAEGPNCKQGFLKIAFQAQHANSALHMMLNQPYIPGINPTWSWYIILFIYCWIQFPSILFRIFVSKFKREIGL